MKNNYIGGTTYCKIGAIILFCLVFFRSDLKAQQTFDGDTYNFVIGDCHYIESDTAINDFPFLVLSDHMDPCNDRVSVATSSLQSMMLATTGIFLDTTEVGMNFTFTIHSDTSEYAFGFSQSNDSLFVEIMRDPKFLGIRNELSDIESLPNLEVLVFTGLRYDFDIHSIIIEDIGFTTLGNKTSLILNLAGFCDVSDYIEGNKFIISFLNQAISVDSVSLTYNGVLNGFGIYELIRNPRPISINTISQTIEYGTPLIVTGNNLIGVKEVYLNSTPLEITGMLGSSQMTLAIPYYDFMIEELVFVGHNNIEVKTDLNFEHPFNPGTFSSLPIYLIEDDSLLFAMEWQNLRNDSDSSYFKVIIRDSTSVIYTSANLTNKYFLTPHIVYNESYTIDLYTYNAILDTLILTSSHKFQIATQDELVIHPSLFPILEAWDAADTISLMHFLALSNATDIQARSFLQSINRGVGFDNSLKPWFSNDGEVLFALNTRNDVITDPPGPDSDDPEDIGKCKCEFTLTNRIDPFRKGDQTHLDFGYTAPEIRKHVQSDENKDRVWRREQWNGAAVYTELYSHMKGYRKRRQSHNSMDAPGFLDNNNPNLPPGDSFSEISVLSKCSKRILGKLFPCRAMCELPSRFEASYRSKLYHEHSWNTGNPRRYEMYGHDEVNFAIRHGATADWEILKAAHLMTNHKCSSGINPDFWSNLGSFLTSMLPFIDFDDEGFSFDLSDLSGDDIEELIEAFGDLIETQFILQTGDCINLNSHDITLEYSHPFVLVPNRISMFRISTRQSAYHDGQRSTMRTVNLSDYYLAAIIADETYNDEEWDYKRELCCQDSYGVYSFGTHDTLWLNGHQHMDEIRNPDLLDEVRRDYFNLRQSLGALFHIVGLLPSGGLPVDINFNKTLRAENIYCGEEIIPKLGANNSEFSQELGTKVPLIFPNPGNSDLHIFNLEGENVYNFRILTLNGQILYNHSSHAIENYIIPSSVFIGSNTYILQVNTNTDSFNKIIIRK